MSEVNKIANYNQMMSWLTRPATPKTQVADLVDDLEPGSLKDELKKDFDPSQETHEEYLQRKNLDRPFNAQDGGRANLAIGSEPETTQAMTGLVDNLEQPIEDTTMGPMTAGLLQTGKAAIGLPKKITSGFTQLKDAAEKYGLTVKDWMSKTKNEKAVIAYKFRNKDNLRAADAYVAAPDKLLTRIEPSKKTLAKTDEELIAALRLRRNMNDPEYWTNLEALSKNTGKSVRVLEKELAPEGGKVFSFQDKLNTRFDKDTIEKMFPSAKSLSRVKEFQNIFKSNNKKPINFSPRGSGSLNYLTEPNLFNKRVELIKSKKLDMNALYSQAELKEIFNTPNFSLDYVENAIPGSVKREGPIVAKKGTPGGVKSGLTSINDVIAAFETKINKKIITPRGIGFAGRKAQQEIDQDLFKVTGESFRKVLSRKIRENSKTKKIEAFTGSDNLDPQITSILQKYDVKVPQIAHLNPTEFAKRKVLSDTKDPTVDLKSILGNPRFPGFSKNLDQLYTTDNLGFQGRFFNNSVVGRPIQFEIKKAYNEMQPIIMKYQGKKVPLKIQEQIKILNGQVNALLKKSRANQFKFKEEMSGAAKNFEDLYSGTLGKTGPYGEVRLAEDIGKNELKVINLDPKNASPFIKNKSKGALGVSADNFSDLSDSQKVKAKQNWFNNFKGKMLIQIPDANEKKIIEKYLDLYISPLEQRAKNIDPITGKSIVRKNDPRRTDTSYNEGGRVSLKEGTPKKPIFSKGAAKQLARMAIFNPAGALTTAYTLGGSDAIDPRESTGRLSLGAEAAAAKELVRGSQNLVRGSNLSIKKQRAVQKLLNLGLSPKMAIRAARLASPLGIATLLGEGVYQGGKYMLERKKLLESLSDEQRDELLSREKTEAIMQNKRGDPEAFSGIMAASGGLISRQGFADGPDDPAKRKFMKIIGGLATLPILGKFIKPAAKTVTAAAPVVIEAAKSVPPYFFKLVEKIKLLGDDVTRGASTQEREVVTSYKDYMLTEDLGTGNIVIRKRNEGVFYDQDGIISDEYMTYNPGRADETNKVKPADEYDEYTVRPDGDGKLSDSEDGLDNIEEILKEVDDK